MTTIKHNGQEFDFDAAVNLMDDDLRLELHAKGDGGHNWTSDQAFFNAYCRKHFEKFDEEFVLN